MPVCREILLDIYCLKNTNRLLINVFFLKRNGLHWEIKELIPCSFIYWSPIFHGWVNLAPFVYPQEPLSSSNIYWYAVREVINALRGPIAGDFAAAKHLYSSQAAANDDRTHHALHSHQLPALFTANVRFSTLMTTGVNYFPQVHRVSWEKWGLADRISRFCRDLNIFIFQHLQKNILNTERPSTRFMAQACCPSSFDGLPQSFSADGVSTVVIGGHFVGIKAVIVMLILTFKSHIWKLHNSYNVTLSFC